MAVYKRKDAEEETDNRPSGLLIFIAALVFILVVAAVVLFLGYRDIHGTAGKGTDSEITVSIEQGSGVGTISEVLKENNIINYPFLFKMYVKNVPDAAQKMQYGEFKLTPHMSYDEIIEVLTTQTVSAESVRVTIPEGSTLLYIADKMEEAGLCTADEFIDASENGDFSQFDFWNKVDKDPLRFFQYEGYFFPDTYDFEVDGDAYDYVCTFFSQFDEMFTEEMYSRADELGMTLNDVVTLASFVQEEAGNEESGHVSAVFHNRLASDSPYPRLESNACSYVENPEDNNYLYNWIADYYGGFDQIPAEKYEAYNTYEHEGLPAGAISNPGIDAIQAALWPDEEYLNEKYYFFVTDSNGKYYYGKTPEEHSANVSEAFSVTG